MAQLDPYSLAGSAFLDSMIDTQRAELELLNQLYQGCARACAVARLLRPLGSRRRRAAGTDDPTVSCRVARAHYRLWRTTLLRRDCVAAKNAYDACLAHPTSTCVCVSCVCVCVCVCV